MSKSTRKSTRRGNKCLIKKAKLHIKAGLSGLGHLTAIAQVIGAVSLPALLVADMLLANPAWAAAAPVILPVAPVMQHGTPIAVNTVGNTMTITQTAPTNIVQWQSFNIGAGNTVNIAQPNAAAVLLNKVDVGTTATTINGMLNANGRVYIYNPNGVIFGRGATVNADTLIASSLKFDETRVKGGLLMPGTAPVLGADPAFAGTLGAVQVDGDVLSWATLKANTGGSIILAGPSVVNNGRMYAPDGQVILAAGNKVYLAAPQISLTGTSLRGLVVEVSNDRTIVTPAVGATPATSVTTTGISTAENGETGQIDVAHGNATMVGYAVNQKGLISATTSVSMNGSVYLFARDQAIKPNAKDLLWTAKRTGTLTLGAKSLTQVIPATVDVLATQADVTSGRISEVTGLPVAAVGEVIVRADTATISAATISSATTAFTTSEVKLNGADIQLQGDGAAVNPKGAQIIAHAGNVTIQAQRLANNAGAVDVNGAATLINPLTDIVRVDFAPGSNVDVSGTTGTTLSMESNVMTVDLRGTELADNVVLRNSTLYGSKVQIDVRKGTAMANVSGWLGLVEKNIGQLSTTGGTVNVSADGAVIQRAGSTINVNGGYVDYLSGYVNTTQMQLGEKLIDIGSALTNTAYTAVVTMPNDPLLNYQAGYRQGSSAGTVSFSAPIEVLQGSLSGKVTAGALQRDVAAAAYPQGGQLLIGNFIAIDKNNKDTLTTVMDSLTGKLVATAQPELYGYAGNLQIGGTTTAAAIAPAVGAAFDLTNIDQNLLASTLDINPVTMSANGFSRLTGMTSGNINVLTPVSLAAGGHLWLAAGQGSLANSAGVVSPGGTINISAPVTIPGGSVAITAVAASTAGTAGQVNIANGVGFDLAGRWVNDLLLSSPTLDANGYPVTPVILKGGSLRLTAPQLTVGNNVSVDVSAGAWLNQAGKLTNGTAGSITLTAAPFANPAPANAVLQLGTGLSLSGYGFSSGGTVNLTGRNVMIGALSATASASDLWLDPLFFQQGGFTNYNISANVNFDLLANTVVKPQAKSLMFASKYTTFSSGLMSSVSSPNLFALSGTATTRAATNVTFSALSGVSGAGSLVVNSGAKLILDPGANLSLYAGQQLTELGMLSAQAGNIMLGLTTTTFNPANSIWFGSAASVLATGSVQRMFTGGDGVTTGSILDGGTIKVGVLNNGVLTPSAGFVVAQAGSVFDVSGAYANGVNFKLNGQISPKQNVASSGGSIDIQARDGLLFAGLLKGSAGGVGASGGSLSLTLDGGTTTPANPTLTNILTVLQQNTVLTRLFPANWQPGQAVVALDTAGNYMLSGTKAGANAKYAGQGYLSAGSFSTGGFARLTLKSKDVLAFGLGSAAIDLTAKDAIILDAPNLTAYNNSGNNSVVATNGVSRALTINSAYVQLGSSDQAYQAPGLASTGKAKLVANATTLDLIGNSALQGFGGVSLNAKGDIRLVGLSVIDYTLQTPKNSTGKSQGSLSMAGVLSLQDAQTYPTTLSDFTFMVADGGTNPGVTGMKFNGTQIVPGSLIFTSNGNTPGQVMSAAGSLTAIAPHIIQAGTVVAPFGSITLGNIDSTPLSGSWLQDPTSGTFSLASSPNNPYLFGSATLGNLIYPNDPRSPGANTNVFSQPIITSDLTYRAGSVTSVAGAGVVPFGTVTNGSVPVGSDWQYSLSDGTVVSFVVNPVVVKDATTIQRALPVKSMVSHAQNITSLAGSQQNLSGGGSLMAYEFTPGAGGSLDVLANNIAGSKTTIFAINPNYQSSVAPVDTSYSTDGGLKAGDSVYLSGMPGLAAGYYTLLPAHYALLSGGFSVSIAAGTANMQANSNTVLANGSMLMSGRLTQSVSKIGSTNTSGFIVSSGSVIRSQSQYTTYDLASYLTSKASLAGVTAPGLPADGGYIAFDANGATSAALSLNGTINLNAAAGGVQGTADFSAPQITVVSSAAQATGTAVQLLAGNLNALGADSLVLGGLRNQVTGGTHLTVKAGTVTLSNDALNPLTGKNIVIAANNSILLNSGSVLQGSGVTAGSINNLILDGSGALLNVSGGAAVGMTRTNPATATGTLTVASGATVGATGSAILDATGGVGLAGLLSMAAGSGLTLGSNGISMGATIPLTLPATSLQIGTNTLTGFNTLSSLNLNSYSSTVDLYGALSLGSTAMNLSLTGAGIQGYASTATLTANTLSLAGTSATASAMLPTTSGLLTATANNLQLGNNSFSIHGFTDSALTATNQAVATSTSGQLVVDGNLTLTSGLITTAKGARGAITAGGNMVLNQIAPLASAVTVGMGGQLSFSAANITSNAHIITPSGKVVMSAGNSGTNGIDITGGQINTAGNGVVFGSTTAYSPGGSISLAGGHVNLGASSILDMSAVGAAGGILSVTAYKADGTGSAQLFGTLKAGATAGVNGILPVQGQFSLLTDNMVNVTDNSLVAGNFGSLNAQLNSAGFAESRQFRFINGDANLTGTDNITARQIAITTDNGSINIGGNAILDARGAEGGSIALYASQLAASGASGNVTVNGAAQLLANSTASQSQVSGTAGAIGRGGSITIATGSVDGLAPTGAGSSINLAGGTMDVGGIADAAGNVQNGSVTLRAPRLASGSDVAVTSLSTAITNSASTVIVGTKVYQGTSIVGTDKNINDLASIALATNLDPSAGGAMYVDAASFMTNQSAMLARLGGTNAININPGIEVRSTGNLTVSVNEFAVNAADRGWNLNAWHFNGAPVDLSLRAAGNLIVTGSISDGFIKPTNTALAMPNWTLGTGASSNISLTGGANLASADPLAVNTGSGSVNFGFAKRVPTAFTTDQLNADGTIYYDASGSTVAVPGVWKSTDGLLSSASLTAPQLSAPITPSDAPVSLVRTGTGSIHIASGSNVTLGMAPFFVQVSTDPSINGTPVPSIDQTEPYSTAIYTAGQAAPLQAGFTAPKNQLNTSYGATKGMMGSAAFGTGGGAVTIDAIGNVTGPQNLSSTWVYNAADGTAPEAAVPKSKDVAATPYKAGKAGTLVSLPSTTSQLVNNWLFRQGRSYTYTDPVTNQVSVMFEQLGSLVYDPVTKTSNVVYTSTLNTAWWAQTGYFNQGVATFGGGDVRVTASTGNIANLSASVATNAYFTTLADNKTANVLVEQGGGNLLLRAGGDILGGSFYVQKGEANIRADGSVGAGNFIPTIASATSAVAPLNPVIALGDAAINVTAGRSAAIESTYNPMLTEQSVNNVIAANAQFGPVSGVGIGASWDVTDLSPASLAYRQKYAQFSNFSTYGANSAVNLMAISGDMLLSNNVISLAVSGGSAIPNALVTREPVFQTLYTLDPAQLNAVALSGNLTSLNGFTMMPSSAGQLNLLAAGSVNLSNGTNGSIRMLDSDPTLMSSINAPMMFSATDLTVLNGTATGINAHVLGGLHTGDTQPVRIIGLTGDIVGDSGSPATVILPKAAEIQAGRDIVNLGFNIQHNNASDVTSIAAGRDFIDTQSLSSVSQVQNTVTGAGRIDISAGRHVDFGNGNGLLTRGNLDNPYLSEGGAAINIVAGNGGVDYAAFANYKNQYGSVSAVSGQDLIDLRTFVGSLNPALSATATAENVWAAFRSLSVADQTNYLTLHPTVVANLATSASGLTTALAAGDKTQLNASFFSSLVELGSVSNLGYFDNMIASLYPTAAGATVPGNINVFASQIKTEQGGAINLFAPTGSIYSGLIVGTTVKKPYEQGIFTIRGGALSALVKNDLLVNQGRVFTLGGGDITLVSQYGNIDAGKGAKTASSAPPPVITVDGNGKVIVDVSGSISGSGIATLITKPGQPPANVYVSAPRGIFNLGDAGVRSTGKLFAVAAVVENAGNYAGGGAVGLPSAAPAAPSVSTPAAPPGSVAKSEDVSKTASNDKVASDKAALKVEVIGYGINSLPSTGAGGDGADGEQSMTPSVEVTGYGSEVNPDEKPANKSESKHGTGTDKSSDAGEEPGNDAKSDRIKPPKKKSAPGKSAPDCKEGEECLELV
jgi:filamentous hemagglutinin family protein